MGIHAKIVLLPGDGIGPEIIDATVPVIEAVAAKYGHQFDLDRRLLGGCAIDASRRAVACRRSRRLPGGRRVLLGAIGGPKWDNPQAKARPEQGLLALRRAWVSTPICARSRSWPRWPANSPVKSEIVRDVDLVVVRELTGGLYFGKPRRKWRERRGRAALDTMIYREYEIVADRPAGLRAGAARGGKLASVDKANVIDTSRLWRIVVAGDGPDVSGRRAGARARRHDGDAADHGTGEI